MKKYIEHLHEKENRIKDINAKYYESVRSKIPCVMTSITGKYPEIEKVIVFGSFTDGRFNTSSDIDLYIQGLKASQYYEAKRFIEEITGIDIDLYTDTDNADFINKVKSRGKVLYER